MHAKKENIEKIPMDESPKSGGGAVLDEASKENRHKSPGKTKSLDSKAASGKNRHTEKIDTNSKPRYTKRTDELVDVLSNSRINTCSAGSLSKAEEKSDLYRSKKSKKGVTMSGTVDVVEPDSTETQEKVKTRDHGSGIAKKSASMAGKGRESYAKSVPITMDSNAKDQDCKMQ